MSQPIKPNQTAPELLKFDNSVPEGFDAVVLLERCGEVLRREVQRLLMESARGKLDKASSVDLVNYIKLFTEMKKEQLAELAGKTEAELKALKGE